METRIEKIITFLKEYFRDAPGVVFAYLFGSLAKQNQTGESDVDIAVYFQPKERFTEIETQRQFDVEHTVWQALERLIGREVDLLVLNRAPATVADAVIHEGIPLVIKDRRLFWDYFLAVDALAEEYRDFARDFVSIKRRSRSLTEIDRDRILRLLDFLETELDDAPSFLELTREQYITNSAIRRNVERWIENCVNASIDISKILLASAKHHIPQTYREALLSLDILPGFPTKQSEILAQNTKLRNILAHQYLDVKFPHVLHFAKNAAPLYRDLCSFIRRYLDNNTSAEPEKS